MRPAKDIIESWRADYNAKRPHSALDDRTPNEFVAVWEKGRFALSNVNKSVASPHQGFPNGALTRGPDPAAQPPKPLALGRSSHAASAHLFECLD